MAWTNDQYPMPKPCGGVPPEDINVYTDGSLAYGRHPHMTLASAGIWWPGRLTAPPDIEACEAHFGQVQCYPTGVRLKAAVPGVGGSSTRAEIAAGLGAVANNIPFKTGTDSKAFLDKACKIHYMLIIRESPQIPWSIQKDGYLWQQFHNTMMARGPNTVDFT